MSKQGVLEFTCPSCSKRQTANVWESINVNLNPELRNEVLSIRVNKCACSCCSQVIELPINLLYHDPQRKFMIWLRYPDKDGIRRINETKLSGANQMFEGYILRLVGTWPEFREKILCLECELDDAALEMLRIMVWVSASGKPRGSRPPEEFRFTKIDSLKKVLTFVYAASQSPQFFDSPLASLPKVAEVVKTGGFSVPRGKWAFVDYAYITS